MGNMLTSSQLEAAKAWLFDFFWYCSHADANSAIADYKTDKKGRDQYYYKYTNRSYGGGWENVKKELLELFEALVYRPVDYKKFIALDKDLEAVADQVRFYPTLNQNVNPRRVSRTPAILAAYIAWYCNKKKFYWNNELSSTYELEEIKKTILGDALWNYRCFVSQEDVPSATAPTSSTNTSTGITKNTGYKASFGALSSKITTLVGNPGVKQHASGQVVFCLESRNNKYVNAAFVKVLDKNGKPYSAASASYVSSGRGNDYFDCKLYFFDLNEAQDFLQKLTDTKGNPDGLQVVKTKPDSNGYFKIKTDCGEAYIRAMKLNEEIKESSTAPKPKEKNEVKYTNAYTINNIEVFDEAFNKYL